MGMHRCGAPIIRAGLVTVTAASLLAGCGNGRSSPVPRELVLGDPLATQTVSFRDGAGLRLPRTLDGFERDSVVELPKAQGVTVSYTGTPAGGATRITIEVRRVGGGSSLFDSVTPVSTEPNSRRALARAVASLRAGAPELAPAGEGNVYLVRFGAIQAGHTAAFPGPDGPVRVDAYCCVNGIWSYTFVVRGGDVNAAARFLRDLPWSASAGASIEEPE